MTAGYSSAYHAVRARALKRVEDGELDPDDDPEMVYHRVVEVVHDYQRDAHLREDMTALADPEDMAGRVVAAIRDYGPLTPLLDRPDVEEIMIHGAQLTYVTADGRTHFPATTASAGEYRQHVERLLHTVNCHVDAAHPIETVGLADNVRLSVKIPPVVDELVVNIRKPVLTRPSLAQMVPDTLSAEAAGLLWTLMRVRCRVVVAGAPTAGKTTLLNALLAAIPGDHAVRVNEEARELSTPLTLGSYGQATNRPGQSLRDLIKADLVFRPDMLVVGEVRGAEAVEVLRPLNAGCGFLTTVHANQAADAVDVLTMCARLAGDGLEGDFLREFLARAIDFVVFLDADESSADDHILRQVTEIAWVAPELRDGRVVHEPVFAREALGKPLEWTGAHPPAWMVTALEQKLPPEVGSLTALLDGRAHVEALA